jgi:hypothetical protein
MDEEAQTGMYDSARNEKEKDPILVVFAYLRQIHLVVSIHLSIYQKEKNLWSLIMILTIARP